MPDAFDRERAEAREKLARYAKRVPYEDLVLESMAVAWEAALDKALTRHGATGVLATHLRRVVTGEGIRKLECDETIDDFEVFVEASIAACLERYHHA